MMTTHSEAQKAIETRFDTNWSDDEVVYRFEQDPRKKPSGPHIRLFVRSLRALEVGYKGANILYRRPGWISMQCFVQVGTGTQAARAMADAAIEIFEGQQFSGVTCRESEVVELGDDGKGFWQANAKVFFDFDFERAIN